MPIKLLKPNLRSKNWSPELTITYTPTDDLTIFGALKQGYKSGSYIMTVPATPNSDNSFGDERVRGGERSARTQSSAGSQKKYPSPSASTTMMISGRNDSAITRGCRQYATARQNESRSSFMAQA